MQRKKKKKNLEGEEERVEDRYLWHCHGDETGE